MSTGSSCGPAAAAAARRAPGTVCPDTPRSRSKSAWGLAVCGQRAQVRKKWIAWPYPGRFGCAGGLGIAVRGYLGTIMVGLANVRGRYRMLSVGTRQESAEE